MKKSAYFADIAFCFAAVFLIALCYLRFRSVPLGWATLVAILLSFGACLLVATLMQKKYKHQLVKASDKREAEMLALHLALLSQKEACEWISERLGAIIEESPGVTVFKHRESWLIESNRHVVYCRFSGAPISTDGMFNFLSYPSAKIYVMLCNGLDTHAKELADRFSLTVLCIEELYLRLKRKGLLPKEYNCARAFEKKKKRRGALWLQKRNAKPFMTGGALTLVSSLFSPFPYYYLVMGASMVAASVALRFWGK